jgi:hypothetical protein
LNDGTSYPARSTLVAAAKNIQVVVQNSGYQKVMTSAVQQAPQPAQSTQTAQAISPDAVDKLAAPIALYPDALVAQILTASTNFFECASFASWLSKNSSLQGSAQQDAAQKAGFDACFVALAPFPQVVQMMVQQKDWTTSLGEAFKTNKSALFASIQRLRAQAQAAGNLKSTSQQEVKTETTSSGQQVIVIQPANPQVVYVPTYNPQTVYVQSSSASTATAAAVGFTAGVIIGAAASNNYYYGPYSWRAAAHNDYWDDRYDYAKDRNEMYQQNASQRQSASQTNQQNRQSAAQSNQAQRQSAASNAQGTAQANQAERRSSAEAAQGNQASRYTSANTSSRGSGTSGAERSGMSSGGFSGFQGGGQARAESERGSRSLGGGGFSREGGGGGSRRGGGGGGRRR